MLTRREVLAAALGCSCTLGSDRSARSSGAVRILAEPDLLSRESAAGFRSLVENCGAQDSNLILLPAVRAMTADLASGLEAEARAGAWLILESGLCFETESVRERQTSLWAAAFGLSFAPFRPLSERYVEYSRPRKTLVRSFEVCTFLAPSAGSRLLAHCAGVPVCCIRRLGRGGVLFLGAMLGPGLFAGEREAHAAGFALIRTVAHLSPGTVSTPTNLALV